MKKSDIVNYITKNKKTHSKWEKGVKEYALLILENIDYDYDIFSSVKLDPNTLESILLNGAKDWKEYSYGGCALVYNEDIANTLCTESELRKTKFGMLEPNNYENWLDVQYRALYQAFFLILETYEYLHHKTMGYEVKEGL